MSMCPERRSLDEKHAKLILLGAPLGGLLLVLNPSTFLMVVCGGTREPVPE